ncbi:hypothetical protein ACFZCP_06340 [Streptomyces sp. NPDC007971]|uniref:hypothetical protein n=1 Tax=Streptomyces sp. NPDC007971 TaxID=3364799 RepID=UPI0036E66FC5
MQGHGHGQPVKQPPHTAWLVFLRVLFVALGLFSIGFLAWVMPLRLAAVTRKALDWGLFVTVLVLDILSIVLLASEPGDEIHTTSGYLGLFLLLGTLVGAMAYYLVAEIRHFMLQQQAYAARGPAPAYGYPGPANPYTASPAPTVPVGPHTPPPIRPAPVPHTPVPQPPPPTLPPQRPAPARIDQVRAELDELSDYLRKHDGHPDGRNEGMQEGHHEGGR